MGVFFNVKGKMGILLVLLLIMLIGWMGWRSVFTDIIRDEEREKLNELKEEIDYLLEHEKIDIQYKIVQSETTTYTEDKHIIHLVMRREDGSFYSKETLLRVLIHEISHIICPSGSDEHPPLFHEIEKRLSKSAVQLKLLQRNQDVSNDYPCINFQHRET